MRLNRPGVSWLQQSGFRNGKGAKKKGENPRHHHILCGCIRPVKQIQRDKFEYFCLWGFVWDIPTTHEQNITPILGIPKLYEQIITSIDWHTFRINPNTFKWRLTDSTFQFDHFFNRPSFGVKNHGFQNSEIHKAGERFSVQIFLHPKIALFFWDKRGYDTSLFVHGILGAKSKQGRHVAAFSVSSLLHKLRHALEAPQKKTTLHEILD